MKWNRELLNYSREEKLAIGIVNPKTTSLFYDKIWIPNSLLSECYKDMPQSSPFVEKRAMMKYLNQYWEIPDEVRVFEDAEKNIYTNSEYINFFHYVRENRPFITVGDSCTNYKIDFEYSHNRNTAILIATQKFKNLYNVNITPFFYSLTDFEKALWNVPERHNEIEKASKQVLAVCIDKIATIVEDELEWKQVLEIREDKKAVHHLRRFLNWTESEFEGKTEEQIIYGINEAYEDYLKSIRKYGIKTITGGFTTLLAMGSSVCEMFVQGKIENIATGLAIASALLTYTVNEVLDFMDYKERKEPIAYLYDIMKKME